MTTLYIKIHKTTGLKYFGKTIKDPYTYKGSGVYWKKHLRKHGNNVVTLVVGEYPDDSPLLIQHAINFSTLYDIVRSKNWANLINENGLDGNCPGTVFSQETRAKIGKASIGRHSPKKGKTYLEYYGTKGIEIINKMKASPYHQATSYEERFGKKVATEMKVAVSKQTSGSNNPNTATWELISPVGIIFIVTNLKEKLKELGLPYGTMKDSVFYNKIVSRGKAKGWKLSRVDLIVK